MPAPTGLLGFSPTTPAAPSGFSNVAPQTDSGAPLEKFSFNFPTTGGVTNISGTTDTVDQSRRGGLTKYTSGSSIAVSLSATSIDGKWFSAITVFGAGTATLTPTTGTINGADTLVLVSGLSAFIYWDGTNWDALLMNTGGGGGAPVNAEYIVGAANAYLTSTAVIPSLFQSPDVVPASPGTIDDEFPGSSLSGSWTWVNQGGGTATVGNSLLGLMAPAQSGITIRYIYQTAPGTPWRVNAKIVVVGHNVSSWNAGLIIADASGKLITLALDTSSNQPVTAAVNRWTNFTTFSATIGHLMETGNSAYLGLEDDGTNLTYWCSVDGYNWIQMVQESRTAFLASGPTRVGLCVDTESTFGPVILSCDWFRRTV